MKKQTKINLRWIALLILIAIFPLIMVQTARAQNIITNGRIPNGTTIDNDVLIINKDIIIDGTVNGDVFTFGTSVMINGDISGSVMAVGRDIQINNTIGGSLYALGANMDLGTSADIARSLYFGGLSLATDSGSSIGRDLVVLSLGAQLSGQVGRESKAIIGLLEIIDVIRQGIQNQAFPTTTSTISGSPDFLIAQQNNQQSDTPLIGISETRHSYRSATILQVNNLISDKQRSISFDTSNLKPLNETGYINNSISVQTGTPTNLDTARILNWLGERLTLFVTYLAVGWLLIWLFPSYLRSWSEKLKSEPLLSSGYGLLGLIIAMNGFVIAAVIAAIILAIGIGLGLITLWNLSFYFMGIGFSTLVLVLFIFALFIFYISKIIVAYLIGFLILQRYAPKASEYKILALALGLVIFILITAFPYLGWALGVIAMILGLGAVWLTWRHRDR